MVLAKKKKTHHEQKTPETSVINWFALSGKTNPHSAHMLDAQRRPEDRGRKQKRRSWKKLPVIRKELILLDVQPMFHFAGEAKNNLSYHRTRYLIQYDSSCNAISILEI